MTESASAPTIMSLLCSDHWTWSPNNKCTVNFNEDGTGELRCGVEFSVFVASQFDWSISSDTEATTSTTLPAAIEMTMTLTKRPLKHNPPPISHTTLKNAAFVQKTYKLCLEKGRFKVWHRTSFGHNPTYEYRLLWDESPYPPLEEWNAANAAKGGRYWERRDFYRCEVESAE